MVLSRLISFTVSKTFSAYLNDEVKLDQKPEKQKITNLVQGIYTSNINMHAHPKITE